MKSKTALALVAFAVMVFAFTFAVSSTTNAAEACNCSYMCGFQCFKTGTLQGHPPYPIGACHDDSCGDICTCR